METLGFPLISSIRHIFIITTGEMECKLDFQLCILIFFPEKCPWEIFAFIWCLLAQLQE